MDTSNMQYPFGRCINCGKEFNSELRNEYEIIHCPWCGHEIDDFMSPAAEEHPNGIYCEECGQRISGLCGRELCGNCVPGPMLSGLWHQGQARLFAEGSSRK